MAFDPKEYKTRVLNPYRADRPKQALLQEAWSILVSGQDVPPSFSLCEMYAITSATPEAEYASQVDAVGKAINQANVTSTTTTVFKTLLGVHKAVVERYTLPTLATKRFWEAQLQKDHDHSSGATAEIGRIIGAEYRVLGIITAQELSALAERADVPNDASLAQVAKTAGIEPVPDFPSLSLAAPKVSKDLGKTPYPSLVSAIFFTRLSDLAPFYLLDGFTARTPDLKLSIASVNQAKIAADSRGHSEDQFIGVRDALGTLLVIAKTDADLQQALVAHFLGLGEETLKEVGAKSEAVERLVARTGIERIDAARIIAQVSPSGGTTAARGYPNVQALITAGNLKEARRAYEALFAESAGSETEAQKQALAALQGTERKVEELRQRAAAAQTQGDMQTATKALNEALTICSDDESLAAAARALPPAAPIRFVASLSEDARIARLSWEPGFGSTDDVRYQVIRKIGAPPQNNTDGTSVGNDIQATSFENSKPPVAVKVYYGVSASRGGGASPVAVAELMALPPVTDVVVTSAPSSVTLRWTTPPEASTIEIVQTASDGSTTLLQAGTQSGTTSGGLRMGATYTYLLTAIYFGTSGERLKSATVRATGVPRGTSKPVSAITLTAQAAAGAKPEVGVEWAPIEGYTVEVWHYAQKPSWLTGSRLAMSEIRNQGTQLAGRSIARGEREGVRGATDQGLRYYVAVTRDGEFGLIGAVQPYGTAPPVQNLRAERFGDEAVLSFDWPGPEYQVRVRWNGAASGERIIAMNEYRTEGGCRIPLGSRGGTLEVASVAGEGDTRWDSTPVSLAMQGTAAAVEYDVDYQKKLFGPPSGATLKFSMQASATPIDVVVVAHFNKWMPSDSSQGSVLKQTTVSAASPLIEVSLPRGRKGPVWVRAFAATPGVRLIDPPPIRMKVE